MQGDLQLPGTWSWRRQWHPTPVLLPGKSHGQRSLVGCRPWGLEELDTTERLHFHFSLSCIGEGNGKPLQCSCLDNPRDGEAWWAAIYGVAQSRTRLRRLSSILSITWANYNHHPWFFWNQFTSRLLSLVNKSFKLITTSELYCVPAIQPWESKVLAAQLCLTLRPHGL